MPARDVSAAYARAFERNLRALLDLAAERGDTVALMTFATYLARGYSFQAFASQLLDYGLHDSPLELWGQPEHVLYAVRRLAAGRPDVVFVDQAASIPPGARFFNDACHLTVTGIERLAENLVAVLPPGPVLAGREQRAAALR